MSSKVIHHFDPQQMNIYIGDTLANFWNCFYQFFFFHFSHDAVGNFNHSIQLYLNGICCSLYDGCHHLSVSVASPSHWCRQIEVLKTLLLTLTHPCGKMSDDAPSPGSFIPP